MQAAHSQPGVEQGVETALRAYADLLGRWTQRINLISRRDEASVWERHVQDSLRLLPLIPAGIARAIDLGSGAGLPGLVLALASRVHFDLIEADRRKATFLLEAQRVTGAPVSIHCTRIEAAALPPAALVTARALSPLPTLLRLAERLLEPGGIGLFPKGIRAADEVAAARRTWRFDLEIVGGAQSPILVVRGLARG